MRVSLFALCGVALCAAADTESRLFCIRSATGLPRSDSWPKNPAPEAWVKVQVGGRLVCTTEELQNSVSPVWDHCCHVAGSHEHSTFSLSVFDSDFAGPEADWLGSATLPANATGVHTLPLQGGMALPASTLTVELVPPSPPANPIDLSAKRVAGGEMLEAADLAAEVEGKRRFMCVMSAEGLVETDFFPRVGSFRKPDAWVNIGTFEEKSADIPWDSAGMDLEGSFEEKVREFEFALSHGDEAAKAAMYRAAAQGATSMTHAMSREIHEALESAGEAALGETRAGHLQCATPIVSDSVTPNWSYCCDVTEAASSMFVFELYDEDTLYSVNDFLGASYLRADAEDGQWELPVVGAQRFGGDAEQHATLHVLVATTDEKPPLGHIGEDCWGTCGASGVCPEFCGSHGACCRGDVAAPGCPLYGSDPFWHSCVAADMTQLEGHGFGGWFPHLFPRAEAAPAPAPSATPPDPRPLLLLLGVATAATIAHVVRSRRSQPEERAGPAVAMV